MILDKIILEKKNEVLELKKPRHSLKKKLAQEGISLLAEIKKASPSKGLIQPDFNPEAQLKSYQQAGAAGISILTDQKFFQGSNEILKEMRQLTDLPILRKEFIIDSLQLYESFFIGADVVLLIAAVLSDEKLRELLAFSRELKMEAIVEVHNCDELERVINTEAEIIGINNRDLNDFSVDLKTTAELAAELEKINLRDDYYLIAESGIKTKADIDYLKEVGVDGVLIGETLMRAEDPTAKVKELGLID
ncbi:indole-3-glycerol phosphate synthase [Halanaerobium saccharolyticum]|jgi:indole-3-glycerol phosphate synthase|uniref:Indole-3-glycerol phosphate synthase n=1 Tax=Halanaerobium saccharolyticum TaxID=43595 RepID=A0A4R6RWC2_9FIRM|nr:indole-3-glycerol phosphate synthase TrpC [Halanaerobium saccharolyticum]TDP91321.1 indole-3-glycerol phosphate synthase [Halanaerobium saccharolyticum]